MIGVAAATLLVTLAASSRSASDPLDAYRRFVATPAATRLLAVARAEMERYWSDAPADSAAAPPDSIADWPAAPVAVYLTLRDGATTRACVGSPAPVRASLEATVKALAVEALRADRRHPVVRREELERVRVVIAFTDEGVLLADPMLVDPGRDGLLVGSPRGHVAFLPGEARTVRWALSRRSAWACSTRAPTTRPTGGSRS